MTNIYMYLVTGFAAIGGLLFGYDIGVISGVIEDAQFIKLFGMTIAIKSMVVSTLVAGCFIGALFAGWLADKIGRKMSIMISSAVFTIGATIQTFSYNITFMYIGCFVAGLSIGLLSMAVPLYQSELADPAIRGRLVSLQQWAITIGIALSFWTNYLCNKFMSGENTWRLPLGLQTVPAIILFVGCFFMPYSHRWLISVGRESEGLSALARLRTNGNIHHPRVLEEFNEVKEIINNEREMEQSSYSDLFTGSILRCTLLGIFIQAFQQLTGINSVMFYAPLIFKQAGFGHQAVLLAAAINGIVNVVSTIPAILYVDQWGRRKTLMAGAIIMGIGMGTVGVVMATFGSITKVNGEVEVKMNQVASYSVIVFIYIFVAGFAFSWGPIAWIYPGEIFPMRVRSKGTSLTTASNWGFNYLISSCSPFLMDSITWGLYIIFACFCAIMTIAIYFFYPETRGYSLEEIDTLFNQGVSARNPISIRDYPNTKMNMKE
ncbi:hypothetical protein DSO57_1035152 [Entomophthora muscae]|uniref:Uncharacterized protein n=1 Tax=Entomophthora muscae TaxID=34485 RepID=A0ACC2SZX1_9FUNG|nr:hypothetical protein DSO57_1035152 [Entomophthora muscae]